MKYVALLRGINVGGKNSVKMADLKMCLSKAGFENVQTYINSGNVIFGSKDTNKDKITDIFEDAIEKQFGFRISTVILSQSEFEAAAKHVPKDWLKTEGFKYNYIFIKAPYDMQQISADVGEIKPDIETLTAGEGILYQSASIKSWGRTTFSRIVGKPVYKVMTIRNHNTVTKIVELLQSKV